MSNDEYPELDDMLIGEDALADDEAMSGPTGYDLTRAAQAGPATHPQFAMPAQTPISAADIAAAVAGAAAEAMAEAEREAANPRPTTGGRPRKNPDVTQRELGRLKTAEKRAYLNNEADIAFAVLMGTPGFRGSLIAQLQQAVTQRLGEQTEYLDDADCYDLARRAYVKAFGTLLDDNKCREVLERLQAGYGGHTGY